MIKKTYGTDLINQDELIQLLDRREGLHLSLFMPVEREPDKWQVNRIRLKNLIKRVPQQLKAAGQTVHVHDIQRLLEPIVELMQNGRFAVEHSYGLAIYLSPGFHRIYRLPITMDELVIFGKRFHIKPLLPLLGGNSQYYLLALSQNQTQLWCGTEFSLEQVEIPAMPKSITDTLPVEKSEPTLQYHTGTSPKYAGDRSAVYHGHNGNEKKEDILRYFREINEALKAQLIREKAPLLIASDTYLLPIYKEINSYPYLLPDGIPGNPDNLSASELHKKAWEIIHSHFDKKKREAIQSYQELMATDRTSQNLSEIVSAAAYGQVDTLFVAIGSQEWGRFDPATGELERFQDNEINNDDLFNLATAKTLIHGGTVYAMLPEEMPDQISLAAILRYSMN